jgi:alpha-galactosidase/6-phospho-beta-glucosidase family protein
VEEVERLKAELAECEAGKKELERRALTSEKRDRILAALGVGKQSPQYKRVKAVLDQLLM